MLKVFFKSFVLFFIVITTQSFSAITINSATLDGSTSVNVDASEDITASVTATNTNGTRWRSTAWFINGVKTCVNTSNKNYNGQYNVSFDIEAPSSTGTYSVSFVAYSDNGCSSSASNTFTLTNSINVSSTGRFLGTNTRAFTQLYKKDLYGDIKIFGNTILGSRECISWNWWGSCTAYSSYGVCPATTANNANINTTYFDIDSDASTFNSSSSDLSLTQNSTIKKAYLYWQGLAQYDDYEDAKKIKLKVPNSSSYIDIVALDSKLNWSQYGSSYYPYQATVDITEYMQGAGTYTVANLFTTQGQVSGLGTYGAWSIVVVYENQDEPMKNVTVYDGYTAIDEEHEQTINLSGFLTPTNGEVKSKFLVFAGEGDVDITGDYIELDGTKLKKDAYDNGNNAFNSSITEDGILVTSKNPSCTNNLGIDIHTFNVGSSGQNIIKNSQTSANVKLGSSQDMYFPSVFAFSTQLYIPDICYEEVIKKDGEVATEIFSGDLLDVEVTISNMSEEPAKGVSLKRTFEAEDEYERNSTKIQTGSVFVPKTDTLGDDEVIYTEVGYSLILNLGDGANANYGGLINLDNNETFTYQFSPQIDGNLTSFYLVTYTDESDIGGSGAVTYSNVPVGKCSNRDITSTVLPILPSGKVRIVEKNKNWNDNNGRLFTKIVNKPAEYDILFATNDTGITLTSGKINKVEILNIEDIANPVVVATPINTLTTINQRLTINVTHLSAYKRLQFKITLEDDTVAFSNDFSVRPAEFRGSITGLFAGETLTLTPGNIFAVDEANNPANLYSKTLGLNNVSSITVDASKTCSVATKDTLIESLSFTLNNGVSTSVMASFKDIVAGVVLKILDNTWVATSDDILNADCIVGSSTNVANASGLFGCNVEGDIVATVTPYELNVTNASFTTSSGANWLYMAEISDMNVTASATVQANNKQHQPLQNFTASCYASDVDLGFFYNVTNPNPNTTLSYAPATLGVNETITNINKTLTIPASAFSTPSASTQYSFNVDRVYNLPLNPVDITLTDVKVTTTDVAKDENNAVLSATKRFYYAKVSTKDVTTNLQNINHNAKIEVYSNSALAGFTQSSINWYQMGDDSLSTFLNIAPKSGFAFSSSDKTLAITPSTSGGYIGLNIQNNWTNSGDAYIHLDVPEYLWYNKYSEYNATSDCGAHPCFRYIYNKADSIKGIKSGTYDGQSITNDGNYTGNYDKSGVKTFR